MLKFWCIIGIMATAALVLLVAMAALLPACAGHGAIVYPPSRNAIDHSIEPWKSFTAFKGQFCSGKYDGPCWCPTTDASGKLSGASGQACWWFSNGCSIGCPSCDGVTRGPIYVRPCPRSPFISRPHLLSSSLSRSRCASDCWDCSQ